MTNNRTGDFREEHSELSTLISPATAEKIPDLCQKLLLWGAGGWHLDDGDGLRTAHPVDRPDKEEDCEGDDQELDQRLDEEPVVDGDRSLGCAADGPLHIPEIDATG